MELSLSLIFVCFAVVCVLICKVHIKIMTKAEYELEQAIIKTLNQQNNEVFRIATKLYNLRKLIYQCIDFSTLEQKDAAKLKVLLWYERELIKSLIKQTDDGSNSSYYGGSN